jgi:hypothetical protein
MLYDESLQVRDVALALLGKEYRPPLELRGNWTR